MDDDAEFEEQLRLITEESLRHYEQVELPRILSQRNPDQAGSSRYFSEPDIDDARILQTSTIPEEKKPNNAVEWEDMELEDDFEEVIQMQLDQAEARIPVSTNPGLNSTLTTLERDEEAPGFHRDAGRTWVFPTDFPERRYQFDICQTAIFHNTLVCLPTGLGKTFIAAVVMYNMYRWYPQGCVIFLAPTRPLVNQQVMACRNIAGLPQEHTSELTGSINPNVRRELWRSRRVFFMTPQTLANDLASGIADPMRIRCVVLDEAHRARGNHAYCQLLDAIRSHNRSFRLLALSATPGANIAVIKEVLMSLGVSRLEARAEDSKELAEFTHQRKIETIVLPLGSELLAFKQRIYTVVDEFSRTLRQRRLIQSGNLTKYGVLKASLAFRARNAGKDNIVESEFAVTLALCQAAELLCHHGLRAFYSNLTSLLSDPSRNRVSCRLRNSTTLTQLLDDVRASLGGDLTPQVDGALASYKCTHPKMQRLVQLVVEHLQRCHNENRSSRVIVFCQFRDVVTEIRHALDEHKPLIRPTQLIGQANASAANRGQTQKEQRQVLRAFNEGMFNVMIATCVGEEGLDIAEVDLIICYEPHSSPIRLVQRMGRTGRKRDGRVVMLITEGREQQKYQQSVSQGGTISKQLLRPENFREALAKVEPSMLPSGLVPTVMRMTMSPRVTFAEPAAPVGRATKTNNNQDLRVMMAKKAAAKESIYASHEQMLAIGRPLTRLRATEFLHDKTAAEIAEWEGPGDWTDLGRWIEWQRLEQDATVSPHSTLTQDLVHLLQFSSRRAKLGCSTQNVSPVASSPSLQQAPLKIGAQQSPLKEPASRNHHAQASQQGPKKGLPLLDDSFMLLSSQLDFHRDAEPNQTTRLACRKAATTDWTADHVCENCRVLREAAVASHRPLQVRPVSVAPDFPRGMLTYKGVIEFTLKTLRLQKPNKKLSPRGVSVREIVHGFGEWADITADLNISESAELAAGLARHPDGTRQSTSCAPRERDQSQTDFFDTLDCSHTSKTKKTDSIKKPLITNQRASALSALSPTNEDDIILIPSVTNRKETTPRYSSPKPSTSTCLKESPPVFPTQKPSTSAFAHQKETTPRHSSQKASTSTCLKESPPVFPTQKPSTSAFAHQKETTPRHSSQKPSTSTCLKESPPVFPTQKPSTSAFANQKEPLPVFPTQKLSTSTFTSQKESRPIFTSQNTSTSKTIKVPAESNHSAINVLKPNQATSVTNQSIGDANQSMDMFEPWDLDVAAIDRACALREETLYSVEALMEQLEKNIPYQNEGETRKAVTPVDELEELEKNIPYQNEGKTRKALTPVDELDLSDLLEGFNNPVVSSGIARSTPLRGTGRRDLPSDAFQSTPGRGMHRKPSFESPPSPILELANEQGPSCLTNEIVPISLHRANEKHPSDLRVGNEKPSSKLRLANEKPPSKLRLATAKPPSNLRLSKENPANTLRLGCERQSSNFCLEIEKPPNNSHLGNEKPLSNVRFGNDKSPSDFHLANENPPSSLRRANERTPSASERANARLEASVATSPPISLSSRDSNSDFDSEPGFCQRPKKRRRERKQIAGRRRKCQFVESEAESSGRDSSDGENSSGLDAYDSSFVDDVSPTKGGGASQYVGLHASFSPLPSQPPANLTTSYLEDSFVVKEGKESFAEPMELSPLSLAERKLALRRRRRRDNNATSSEDEAKTRKRRRRIRSPSPDESPANRNQRVFSRILEDFDWNQDFSQQASTREGRH